MSTEEKNDLPEVAAAFARSLRGKYIIGQALAVAIDTMKKVPKPHTEVSNIEDMEFLLENLYPIGFISMACSTSRLAFEKAQGQEGEL